MYSVGVLLYEMYHGRRAWPGLTQLQVAKIFLNSCVQSVAELREYTRPPSMISMHTL